MKTNHYSLLAGLGLALCVGLGSCTDEDLASDSHYKPPVFLKGNAYEVLQKDGNYNIFLRGIELSDYYGIVNGKSIVTVVAPTDEAFTEFLAEKGYQSIDDLDQRDHDYLNKLIAYHLMYYAFNWDKMVNFRPGDGDGATEEEKEVYAGYYYKHRTHCSDPIETLRVKLSPNALTDTLINVYHQERYLPVLSNMLFATKGIDAAYNYTYFFPGTEWKSGGVNGTFNIANAKVLDDENVVTDNGYLYHVDHVIEPLNTIYEEMKNNPNYSKFLSIYDSYSEYELAPDDVNNSLGFQAYLHGHRDIPNIAQEWPNSSWQAMSILEYAGYNIFAPTNEAIDQFFTNFWKEENGYTSIDELDPLILQYFIRQSFSDDNFIVFPEEIRKGLVNTAFGTPINIDPDQAVGKLCCNGAFYGMNNMDMPAIFSSVVGPAFSDTTYRGYLYLLDSSSSLLALASNATNFVTLMPSNDQMYRTDPSIRLYETTTGKQIQQWSSDAGAYVEMSSGAMKNYTDMHVAQNVKELATQGVQVVTTNTPYNYWFVKDGQITTNALFNQLVEPEYNGASPFVDFHRITYKEGSWSNGNSYSYDSPAMFEPASGDGIGSKMATYNDSRAPFYMFAQLLKKANLITGNTLSPSISPEGSRFVAFIPTNEVLIENLKSLPGCANLKVTNGTLSGTVSSTNQPILARYLLQYFVSSLTNSFTDYPYIGSSFKGEYMSASTQHIRVTDTGSTITVGRVDSDKTVNVIGKYDYLPFAFSDGCVQFIDGILEND